MAEAGDDSLNGGEGKDTLFDRNLTKLKLESRKINYPETNMSINVTFPEELLIAAREEKETFSRKVIIYTLGHLYQEGKISAGIGAQVLGCDKYTFYTLLSEYGFPVIDYTEEEWQLEVQTSREIADKIQPQ